MRTISLSGCDRIREGPVEVDETVNEEPNETSHSAATATELDTPTEFSITKTSFNHASKAALIAICKTKGLKFSYNDRKSDLLYKIQNAP